jgi:hypothetical protein
MRQTGTQVCVSVCTTINAGAGYSITTNAAVPGNSLLGVGNNAQGYCTYDYLGISSATDSTTGLMGDRFCGEQLNTARAPNGSNLVAIIVESILSFEKFISNMPVSVNSYEAIKNSDNLYGPFEVVKFCLVFNM